MENRRNKEKGEEKRREEKGKENVPSASGQVAGGRRLRARLKRENGRIEISLFFQFLGQYWVFILPTSLNNKGILAILGKGMSF